MTNFILLHQCCVVQEAGENGGSRVELELIFVNPAHIETISPAPGSVIQFSSGECVEVSEKPGEVVELIQGMQP